MKRIPVIGVMGSGSEGWAELAVPLGKEIARRGWHLLTGAGGGVMTEVARAFCSVQNRAGRSIGVVPTVQTGDAFVPLEGYPNPWIEIAIVPPLGRFSIEHPDDLNRNYINVLSSDVVVSLPGQLGTRNEVDLALRLGRPVVLCGPREQFVDFASQLPLVDSAEEAILFVERDIGRLGQG